MRFWILCLERSRFFPMWWRPNRIGYTSDLRAAGQYSYEEALEIVIDARGGEIAVPMGEVLCYEGKGGDEERD